MSDLNSSRKRRPNGLLNGQRRRNGSSSIGETVEMDWNETVYLRGFHPLQPGQKMAAGFLRRTSLRNAVCEVMEGWDPSQRSNATILCGVSTYGHEDIERLYSWQRRSE
jgi:hypothetical protein